MGNQFMALGGTTVNMSGGAVEGIFLAGNYNGTSSDVEVNITGGTIGAGGFGELQAYAGSVTNISGGTLRSLKAHGGVVNISGGAINTISSNAIRVENGSVVNISGGSFTSSGEGLSVGFATGAASVVNLSGGSLADGNVRVAADNELNVFGTEFLLDGVVIDGLVLGVPMEITDRNGTLRGLLADGSPFSIDLNSSDTFGEDYVEQAAMLTVMLALPGDYNNDGTVDAADYPVWRDALGTATALPHDTSPGTVSQLDYDVWRANFGRAWFGSFGSAPTPEPASVLLVGIALAALAASRFFRFVE